jgi:hypothetical protein
MAMFEERARLGPHVHTHPAAPVDKRTSQSPTPSASPNALTATRSSGRIDLDDPLTRLGSELAGKTYGPGRPSD